MTARIHKLWPSVAALVALVLVYFGERVLSGFETARLVFAGASAALLAAALVVRASELSSAPADRKPVLRALLFSTLAIAVALALYALIPLVFSGDGESNQRFRGVIWGLFPVVALCGAGTLIALELAVFPVAFIDRYEERRVFRSINRGLSVALLLSALFLANYVMQRQDLKVDVHAAGRVEPSSTTQELLGSLSAPLRITLFFPQANEVREVLETYFARLEKLPNLELVYADQALDTKLASETGTNENGYVVVSQAKTHEKVRVGEKLSNARSALKSFDQNLAKAVVKVSRPESAMYFTVGHDERRTEAGTDDKRPGLSVLKQLFVANRFTVKPLGVAEGLANDVPADAAVVMIIGPEKPFLPEETAALKRAIERGVRLLIALEPEAETQPLTELLAELGLVYDPTILANEQSYVRASQTPADRAFLYTQRYSSHASVTSMTRNASKLATVFPRTGSLDKLEPAPKNTRVDLVITSLDTTFADVDGDFTHDDAEVKKAYGLAAAVTRTATAGETRAFVIADADVFTDPFVRAQGNPYLLGDVVYWLRDVKDPVVPTVTEEDVRIVHKRDEDALWFYSTTLGVPLLVALGGLVTMRRRRRK